MGTSLYRHHPAALLRAATAPLSALPSTWPDLADPDSCRTWLTHHCPPDLTTAIAAAAPTLAANLAALREGTGTLSPRRIRSTTRSVLRYALRATGRPTPNGTLAGVAPAEITTTAKLRWGHHHRALARVDAEWLAEITTRLENSPALLPHLRVVTSNLLTHRGDRIHLPHGPNRISLATTPALAHIERAAAHPIPTGELADQLAEHFPSATRDAALAMLNVLIEQGALITHLRAPATVTDPLDHLITALLDVRADQLPETAELLADLHTLAADLRRHNSEPAETQPRLRTTLATRMHRHATAGRTPLALDVALDASLSLPHQIGDELDHAATALLRLSRHPTGEPAWLDYHRRCVDRYGLGTIIPILDVLNPGAGLGYPAGYPGSILPEPMQAASPRDRGLLACAWQALATGSDEIVLTDAVLADITGAPALTPPPHVELAVRIRASSVAALDRGDYHLIVSPARSVGTLTGRFTPLAPHLTALYRDLPAGTANALRAQLAFPPAYAVAENISRVPAHLDHLIPLGEHHPADTTGPVHIALTDLAVTATRDRLHLVTRHHGVIEPQVFHALALHKQPAPLVRFLAHLPRAFDTVWTHLDWGPAAVDLPFLPRVRYGRSTLSPARWRITRPDLPARETPDAARRTLTTWRCRWRCPTTVDLHDDTRALRLDLDVPAHLALLRDHLARHRHADLTETIPADELGWIGHAHEIIVPLITTTAPPPAPSIADAPTISNRHGQLPAAPDARWLSLTIHTHPEQMDEVIGSHLPRLIAALADSSPQWWFIRYRSPHETDHIRLRLHTPAAHGSGLAVDAITEWADELRDRGLTGRVAFDTYYPELGRYGATRDSLAAAETVFAADSLAVLHGITHLAPTMPPAALTAAGMVRIARALLGDDTAWSWLIAHKPVMQGASAAPLDRDAVDHTTHLALADIHPTEWPAELTEAWHHRAHALRHYTDLLPSPVPDSIVDALLHMHHNRVVGPDRDREHLARRLARQAALTARAHQPRHR